MNKTIKILAILLIFIILAVIYYLFDPSQAGIPFPQCPSKSLLGLYCPGCGSQRAVHQLLHGNISGAFGFNPLLVIIFPLLIYSVAIMLYNFVFDKNIRIKLFYNNTFVFVFFAVTLLYFIARNLPFSVLKFLVPDG